MRMTKRLLIFIFAASLMMAPAQMLRAADASYEMAQDINDEVTITVNGQTVTICGAQGETLEVISLTGRKVMSVRIDSPAQRIDLGVPKGVYILKVGKVVRKVSLK